MNKQLIASAALLAGIAWAASAQAGMAYPQIESVRVSDNGNIFFHMNPNGVPHPKCATTDWSYVVPASAPTGLRDTVLDAAIHGLYIEGLAGTGNCTANTEVLKSITIFNDF